MSNENHVHLIRARGNLIIRSPDPFEGTTQKYLVDREMITRQSSVLKSLLESHQTASVDGSASSIPECDVPAHGTNAMFIFLAIMHSHDPSTEYMSENLMVNIAYLSRYYQVDFIKRWISDWVSHNVRIGLRPSSQFECLLVEAFCSGNARYQGLLKHYFMHVAVSAQPQTTFWWNHPGMAVAREELVPVLNDMRIMRGRTTSMWRDFQSIAKATDKKVEWLDKTLEIQPSQCLMGGPDHSGTDIVLGHTFCRDCGWDYSPVRCDPQTRATRLREKLWRCGITDAELPSLSLYLTVSRIEECRNSNLCVAHEQTDSEPCGMTLLMEEMFREMVHTFHKKHRRLYQLADQHVSQTGHLGDTLESQIENEERGEKEAEKRREEEFNRWWDSIEW